MAEANNVATLDEKLEDWKTRTNESLASSIGNRSSTKMVIKHARREGALLQHEARLEEDWDIVGEVRGYLRSIRTLEFGLRGNRG